jgi:hypothetical protein
MKRNLLVASIGTLALGTLISLSATAQTCTDPHLWQPPVGGETLPGLTSCGQDATAGGFCNGNYDAPGPAYVLKSTFAAGRTFQNITLGSVAGAGFDPLLLMSAEGGGCGTNAACGPVGSAATPIHTADVPDGVWYIIVTAASIDQVGACGTFSLSTEGTFPVTLQNFTVS